MSHPFPITAKNSQPVPSFLERSRLPIEEIRKDPFKLTRQRSRLKPAKQEERINSATQVSVDVTRCRNISRSLRKIAEELGFKVWSTPRTLGICDIYWQSHQIENFHFFYKGGSVNKFPQMSDILRKINLTRALYNLQSLFPGEYDYYPKTWFLPQQFHEFCADAAYEKRINKEEKKNKKSPVYIVKPDAGTQGEGIYLIKDPHDYVIPKSHVTHAVQEYISNPFLLEKTKFDLRVYVVILSINPINIFISKDGLARFCTVPYKQPTNKNLNDSYMHLTNYSLNKFSDTYIHTDKLNDGSKRTITSVLDQLAKLGHNTEELWTSIEKVIVKTMLAVMPELQIAYNLTIKSNNKVKCFHILGVDIILTDELKPILLEINANPSLSMTFEKEVCAGLYEEIPSYVDKYVKQPVIRETMLLAAPRHKVSHHKLPGKRKTIPIEELTGYESLFESDESEENFLHEIYPGSYEDEFSHLRILERVASLYQSSLSINETMMSANSFRMFARKCCLIHQSSSLTVAAIDILYIEIQRKWTDSQSDCQTKLSFQAFLEAFMCIARRSKLRSPNVLEMVQNLLDYCEANLQYSSKTTLRRAKLPRIPVRHNYRQPSSRLGKHTPCPNSLDSG